MLLRILVDNPGATFTTHVGSEKFVETIQTTCRLSPDPSVQQLLRETLQTFQRENREERDANLKPLLAMWKKEQNIPMPGSKEQSRSLQNHVQNANMPGLQQPFGNSGVRQLPPPVELASRVEEARTSSKLLIQLVQTTPPADFDSHELIKEFAERCNMAYRSLQGFANATNPEPDEDTLKTLIETCEQLSLANSKYQRAKLAATRHRKSNHSNVNSGYNNTGAANTNAQEMPAPELQNGGANNMQNQYPPEKARAQPQSHGYLSGPSAPSTFSPFTASQNSAGNPFSDDNRISMNSTRPQQQQQQQYQANSNSFFAAATANQKRSSLSNRPPQAGSYELPASAANQGHSNHNRGTSTTPGQSDDIASVPPPPGPPPSRTLTTPTQTSHLHSPSGGSYNELYDTSPVASKHGEKHGAAGGVGLGVFEKSNSPVREKPTSAYDDLYSMDREEPRKPSSPTIPADEGGAGSGGGGSGTGNAGCSGAGADSGNSAGNSGAGAGKTFAGSAQGRLRDDEPMTPVAGVSGSGWRY